MSTPVDLANEINVLRVMNKALREALEIKDKEAAILKSENQKLREALEIKDKEAAILNAEIDPVIGQGCTWKGCQEGQAFKTLLNKSGEPWAHLCAKHHKEHDDAVKLAVGEGGKDNMRRMIGVWVKASGGAEKMAKG